LEKERKQLLIFTPGEIRREIFYLTFSASASSYYAPFNTTILL